MRWIVFLSLAVAVSFAQAQDVVQEFSGSGTTTTGFFTAPDRWEVRWNARQVVSVAVLSSDGTLVAGGAGVLRGSLFVPAGGQYYLKICDDTVAPNPPAAPAVTPGPPADAAPSTNAPPETNQPSTNAPPETDAPPANPPAADTDKPSSESSVAWHLQVVGLGASVDSNEKLTVFTPYFTVPDTAVTQAAPPPPPPPPPTLSDDQLHAMVTIKGDAAQGPGFLAKMPDGTVVVVTHLHLLAGNPNVKIISSAGTPIDAIALKGATDRDLAIFAVNVDGITPLPLATDASSTLAPGDDVLVPDARQPGEAVAGRLGKVGTIGPDRIDFTIHLSPNADGAPVVQAKAGEVVAVTSATKRVNLTDDIAAAWPGNPPPGSARIIPYYGMKLPVATAWETYDWTRFVTETTFLHGFHDDTHVLDFFLNGHHNHRGGREEFQAPEENRFTTNNPKLKAALDNYRKYSSGADRNQELNAARELLSDLITMAESGTSTLQTWNTPYAYTRRQAQEELAYRQALRKELDSLGDNIVHFDEIVRIR